MGAGSDREAGEHLNMVPDSELSHAQFRALANSIPNLAWMAHPDGWIFWYNRRWYEYTGTTPEEMVGWGWQSVHKPDVPPEMLERWTAALNSGNPFEMTFPLRRGSDGSYRIFVTRAEPLHEAGEIVGWFGTNTDITEQERTRERLQLVINELNHRVKNTLATVQAIAARSFRSINNAAYETFERRLMSLAGVHDMLTRQEWENASLHDIIQSSISTFDVTRFDLIDVEVNIAPRIATSLAMTLHELSTNAAKYGSLSTADGRGRIECGVEELRGRRHLTLTWKETGGPPVHPPVGEGFGLKLIKRALSGDHGASVTHRFDPDGVNCRLQLPIEDGVVR